MNDLTFQARAAMSRAILARLALMVEPLLDAQDRGIARYTMDPIPTPSPGSEFTRAKVKINLPSERTDIARLLLGKKDMQRDGNRTQNALQRMLDSSHAAQTARLFFPLDIPLARDMREGGDQDWVHREAPCSPLSRDLQIAAVTEYLQMLIYGLVSTEDAERVRIDCDRAEDTGEAHDSITIWHTTDEGQRDLTGRFLGAGGGNINAMSLLCVSFARSHGFERKPVLVVDRGAPKTLPAVDVAPTTTYVRRAPAR